MNTSETLAELVRRWWDFELGEDPLYASYVGDHRHAARLPEASLSAIDWRAGQRRLFRVELAALDTRALSEQDAHSAAILARLLDDALAEHRFGGHFLPFGSDRGFHIALTRLPNLCVIDSIAAGRAYLSRLAAIPRYFDQHEALLREGLARGISHPAIAFDGYLDTLTAHALGEPEASVFYAPLRDLPAQLGAAEREGLQASARALIRDAVAPAYARLARFFAEVYFPAARSTLACAALPNGKAYYQALIAKHTTLDLDAEAIHALGLKEVASLRAEAEGVMREAGFHGDFAAFLEYLRRDPRFYVERAEDYLGAAALIAKRADGLLPAYFARLPRLPYGIAPTPAAIAPRMPGGFYREPPAGGRVAGEYWVNVHDLPSRPLYVLEALTLHEAVPGHHLQIALARELDLPAFRQNLCLTAYEEGWALYCEWLGKEMGFYRDPYSEFGRLTYALWRACRLVVDTGLHAFGWERERAIAYLADNTALSRHECTTEIDRYITWPGQALGYKLGELKLRALRSQAQARLGPRFDLRAFHDALLAQGELPLDRLELTIHRYLEHATG